MRFLVANRMDSIALNEATSLHFGKITPQERNKVVVLLSREGLPVEDLNDETQLFGLYEDQEHLVGTAGLEVYGTIALLRSVSVIPARRQKGYGGYLMKGIEAVAATTGVQQLFLLTTSAAAFFQGIGYVTISREAAPLAIRNTFEFSSLCPASAAFMKKQLVR